jgi:hypothetical protein
MSDNNGNTNINIDDYTIYQYPSETSNTSTLIKINYKLLSTNYHLFHKINIK